MMLSASVLSTADCGSCWSEREAKIAELLAQLAVVAELRAQVAELHAQVADLAARLRQSSKNSTASPNKTGDIARAALVLTHFEHGYIK